ncbi:MAG: beta-xylosidase, partial [Lachnospiraceae bacterium]|nr:beta-xylosidase [Lachnospiraceae bacterium]
YEGHEFLEASSLRKFAGKYYFIYSSLQSHELCYAVSDKPTEGFSFGETLISNGDIGLVAEEGPQKGKVRTIETAVNDTGNTHGSLIEINGQHYVFYHRQTNRKQSCRQACAEKIRFENNKFYQASMTSCGLNPGPLQGKGEYPANICCNLYGKKGTKFLSMIKRLPFGVPYLTQTGADFNPEVDKDAPTQYVKNICDGSVVGYKYFDLTHTSSVTLKVKGSATGRVEVWGKEALLGQTDIQLKSSQDETDTAISVPIKGGSLNEPIYIKYFGRGSFSLFRFSFE